MPRPRRGLVFVFALTTACNGRVASVASDDASDVAPSPPPRHAPAPAPSADAGAEDAGPPTCAPGWWDDDHDPSTPCVSKTNCAAGEYVVSDGGPDTNRTCASCAPGTFTSLQNASSCSPYSECPLETYEGSPPSSTHDRVCARCADASAADAQAIDRCIVRAKAIATGGFDCAVLADDGVACWPRAGRATRVPGLTGARQVTVGDAHACAVLADASVACWGDNGSGQLGDGTTTPSNGPVVVNGMSNAVQVAARGKRTYGVLSDGTAKWWGSGDFPVGWGVTFVVRALGAEVVPDVSNVREVALSFFDDNFLRVDGTVAERHLGLDEAHPGVAVWSPTTDVDLPPMTRLRTLSMHACGSFPDGTTRCWGDNQHGALGDGTTQSSDTPVVVEGMSDALDLAVSDSFSCAITSGGAVKCWGLNAYGELGDGTTVDRLTPTPVSVPSATAISSAWEQTCALLTDGSVSCWWVESQPQGGAIPRGPTRVTW